MAPRAARRALVGASVLVTTFALVLAPALGAWAIDVDPTGAGGAHTTIGSAVAAAVDGDTINVAAGSYAESVTLDKAVLLVGAGAGVTTITGVNGSYAVRITDAATVTGFTIEGQAAPAAIGAGGPSAVWITSTGAGAEISDNVLTHAKHGVYLEAVDATAAAPTVIDGNEFLEIYADQGSGVWISNSSHVEVTGNRFENAVADGDQVGVNLQCNTTDVLIDGNTFLNLGNATVAIANGACQPISEITITDNAVDRFAGSGAFYFGPNNVQGVLVQSNVAKNTSNPNGALVKFADVPPFAASPGVPLDDITVNLNTLTDSVYGVLIQGGSVTFASTASLALTNNTFCRNSTADIQRDNATAPAESGNNFTCALPTLPTGGGSASGQLSTLADTGGEPSPVAFGLAVVALLAGVAFVARGRVAAGRRTAR